MEQRKEVSNLNGPYDAAFFHRENGAFRVGAAIHFAHGIQHDFLQLEPMAQHEETDSKADQAYVVMINNPPQTEPEMELYGPYTARTMWQLYRAIDWTHIHHEETYDIMAEKGIPWNEKKRWTDRAVRYYLEKFDIPRSPAPLDVTLRRAAVMMKPYATLFRNNYPKSNNFFFAAHWWHPAIYEAQMLGGNGKAQEEMVRDTDRTLFTQVLKDRPQRMLLSREMMPLMMPEPPEPQMKAQMMEQFKKKMTPGMQEG